MPLYDIHTLSRHSVLPYEIICDIQRLHSKHLACAHRGMKSMNMLFCIPPSLRSVNCVCLSIYGSYVTCSLSFLRLSSHVEFYAHRLTLCTGAYSTDLAGCTLHGILGSLVPHGAYDRPQPERCPCCNALWRVRFLVHWRVAFIRPLNLLRIECNHGVQLAPARAIRSWEPINRREVRAILLIQECAHQGRAFAWPLQQLWPSSNT